MGELTLLERIREWIGGIGWRVFLWGSKRTEEEYYATLRESFENECELKAHEETEFWDTPSAYEVGEEGERE